MQQEECERTSKCPDWEKTNKTTCDHVGSPTTAHSCLVSQAPIKLTIHPTSVSILSYTSPYHFLPP